MNIVQLGAGASPEEPPQWWMALTVSAGGTIVCIVLIIVGKYIWGGFRPRKLENRFLKEMTANEKPLDMV